MEHSGALTCVQSLPLVILHICHCNSSTVAVKVWVNPTVYSSQIAACDRSAGSDNFKWPPLPPYNGWEKVFRRLWPAPSWRRTRAASFRCGSACGSASSGAFQHLKSRSASLPRRLRCHCSSAPLPAFRDPGAQQTVRSGRCAAGSSDLAYSRLARPLFLPVDEGKGEGRRGRHHHRVPRHHLGDAQRPLSAPCRAQQAVRAGRCAEKLLKRPLLQGGR